MNLPHPGTRPATRRLAGGLAASLVAASMLVGCSSVHSDLGTSDSPCYQALPAASRAVHGGGSLAGVELLTLAALHHRAPRPFSSLTGSARTSGRVCVIEFTGTFVASSVARPLGSSTGRLAVVVLRTPSNRLLGTVLLDHPPLAFGHAHVG